MTRDRECGAVLDRLDDAISSRREPDAQTLAHAHGCATCAEHLTALRSALRAFEQPAAPQLSDERARTIRLRVAHELASDHAAVALTTRPRALPDGYLPELARILAWATLPLPFVLYGYVRMFELGGALLGQLLPRSSVLVIGIASAFGAASWLAVVYGSIPFVAHRSASKSPGRIRSMR